MREWRKKSKKGTQKSPAKNAGLFFGKLLKLDF
jgi:hypothetical protein